MSDASNQLADKLLSEGERTAAYFRGLSAEAWDTRLYVDGAHWTVKQALEHLCVSEHSLRRLAEEIVFAGGGGSPENFSIDAFNQSKTGRFASLTNNALVALYLETRRASAEFARGLTDEQLAMRGRHPAMGDSAVSDFFRMMYMHNTMHIKDIKKVVAGTA